MWGEVREEPHKQEGHSATMHALIQPSFKQMPARDSARARERALTSGTAKTHVVHVEYEKYLVDYEVQTYSLTQAVRGDHDLDRRRRRSLTRGAIAREIESVVSSSPARVRSSHIPHTTTHSLLLLPHRHQHPSSRLCQYQYRSRSLASSFVHYTMLHSAVAKNNIAEVRKVLSDQWVNVNERDRKLQVPCLNHTKTSIDRYIVAREIDRVPM